MHLTASEETVCFAEVLTDNFTQDGPLKNYKYSFCLMVEASDHVYV